MDKSIHLVDDDEGVRGTLTRPLVSGGYRVCQYASRAALIEAVDRLVDGRILLDKPFGRSEIISVLDEITAGQFVATAS